MLVNAHKLKVKAELNNRQATDGDASFSFPMHFVICYSSDFHLIYTIIYCNKTILIKVNVKQKSKLHTCKVSFDLLVIYYALLGIFHRHAVTRGESPSNVFFSKWTISASSTLKCRNFGLKYRISIKFVSYERLFSLVFISVKNPKCPKNTLCTFRGSGSHIYI